jgi:tRNA nucleotidyltransferase/poly(A) polymerase
MTILKDFVNLALSEFLTEEKRISLNIQVPEDLSDISNIFFRSNKKCYLVGGAVRDALMGKPPKDFDIATDATPDEVIEILSKFPKYKLMTVGKSFGVVVVRTPKGEEFEIATFRKDIGIGRRPDSVEFTDIKTDVNRRDLTINSLFYDLETHEVVDYVGGIDDIKNNVVRTVGDPDQRFGEDRLRVLRAFRFALRLGANFDPATEISIVKNNSLKGVSPERIRDEFLKCIVSTKNIGRLPGFFDEFDMFSQIFPGLIAGPQYLPTKNIPVFLASFLEKNDTKTLAVRLNNLKYSADEVAQICFLIDFGHLDRNMPILKVKKAYKNSKLSENDVIEYMRGIPEKVNLAKAFLTYHPSVSPTELMSQGITGKELGIEVANQEQALWMKYLKYQIV